MSDKEFIEETPVELRTKKRATQTQYEQKLLDKNLNYDGSVRDPGLPIDPPIGWNPQPSLFETIRNMVRDEQFRRDVDSQGLETFEEADDFNVPEDPFPQSPYEVPPDEPPAPAPAPTETIDRGSPPEEREGEGARDESASEASESDPGVASASSQEVRQAPKPPRPAPKGPPSKSPSGRPQSR